MKTGLITSNTYQKHDTGQGHPEQIARVSVIIDNFKKDFKDLSGKRLSKMQECVLANTLDISQGNIKKLLQHSKT